MNLLILIISSAAAAAIASLIAGKAKYWLNNKGFTGGHATFVASAMSMIVPVMILLFGNHLIPTDLTFWAAVISAGFAIWTARRQHDGVDPAVRRREMLARFGIIE